MKSSFRRQHLECIPFPPTWPGPRPFRYCVTMISILTSRQSRARSPRAPRLSSFPSPNNPTGNLVSEAQSRALLETGLLVVADEAYYDFCGQSLMHLLPEYRNLVVLRTFSKWAGLAGLRIGAGAMDPDLAATMMGMKPPYNVNLAAEIALLASLADTSKLLSRVESIVAERSRLYELLGRIPGIEPWPSQANFILCKMPEGRGLEVYEGMCRRGVFLRYFDNDLLRDYIRVSVGKPEETDAVISGFRAVLGVDD